MENYLNKYSPGEQTKDLFRQAGREEDLEHYTVKTNFYYWATDNVADFNRLLSILPEEISQEIFHFFRVWTKQLFDGLRPEIIIAEGFKAYDEIAVLFRRNWWTRSQSLLNHLRLRRDEGAGIQENQGSIINKNLIFNPNKLLK